MSTPHMDIVLGRLDRLERLVVKEGVGSVHVVAIAHSLGDGQLGLFGKGIDHETQTLAQAPVRP